ncbi:MAG: FecR domain-containing protein, partial [Rhodospirillales bacterium]
MNVKADDLGAGAPAAPVLVEATPGGGAVALPDGFAVSDAAFGRQGADLVLTAPGGGRVVVRDYFAQETPPTLATPDGARISGPLAERLAGPMAPGQVAAAGDAPAMEPSSEAIGKVTAVGGRAFVVRADGTRAELNVDTPLYPGDILETGADGALGVVLADETTFSMGGDGRMVLDEMIYDPETQEGSLSLSVVKGLYTFVSGMVSKTDPDAMTIETPIGTIGIRGTQVGLDLANGKDLTVVMMEEADGYVGEVFITNSGGVQVMNQAHQVLFVGAFDREPVFMAAVDPAGVVEMFGATLRYLPTTTGRENDYSAPGFRPEPEDLDGFQTDAGESEPEPEAPAESIRVVEGDYTEPETLEPVAPPAPEALVPSAPAADAPPPIDGRRDEETVPAAGEPAAAPVSTPPVLSVAAAPVSTPPVLSVVAASGPEDTAIPLSVAVVEGTAAISELTVSGVPIGAQLSAGTDNGDGSWTLAPDEIDGLTLTPPADWSGDIALSVVAAAADGLQASAGFGVSVASVPDQPIIGVSAVSGPEDAAIPLSITADVPGTEELASVIIGGVPEGATLSAGGDNGDGTWTLAGADLENLDALTLTPAADSSADMTLTVKATSTDGGTATAAFTVAVAAVADTPALQVADVTVDIGGDGGLPVDHVLEGGEGADVLVGGAGNDVLEGGEGADVLYGDGDGGVSGPVTVPLDIQASLADVDASESLSVAVAGLPEGAQLSAGTDNGGGSWTLAPDELDGLGLTLPQGHQGDFQLRVTATATDTDAESGATDQAMATATIDVAVTGGGAAGDDVLEGGEGADVLYGGAGNDVLHGGKGDDVLYGGAGDDILKGGKGDDVLEGGAGDDVILGGKGSDVFVFKPGAGKDIIEDFREG